MQRKLLVAGSIFLLVVSGCATHEYVKPESLVVPSVVEVVELQADLTFKTDENRGTVTLVAGSYSSVQEDLDGIYFRGPPQGVHLAQPNAMGGMRYYTWDGGFWMPKSKEKSPRVYTYPSSVAISGTPPREANNNTNTNAEGTARANLLASSVTPPGTSPAAAGLGAGLGMGVLALITTPSEADKQRIGFRFDPIPDRAFLEIQLLRSQQKPNPSVKGTGLRPAPYLER